MSFLLCSLPRSSFVSVVFVFNASFNDSAPASSILLPVGLTWMEKSRLLMNAICVMYLLRLLNRSSAVSVVFDFNASFNDVTPVSPILLPVDLMRMKKEWIVDGCHLCVVSFVFTTQIELIECCVCLQCITQ